MTTSKRLASFIPQSLDLSSVRAAKNVIKMAAGAADDAAVYFSPWDDQPPRLQRKASKVEAVNYVDNKRHVMTTWTQRVIVGRGWLMRNLPEAWAAFAAARLTGADAEFIPRQVQGGSKWQW